VVSEPPRPRVVTSRSSDTPWKPATTGTFPSARVWRSRSPFTSRIRARPWKVSVMIPAWLPVNEAEGTPTWARAMHRRAMDMRSPAVSSMSSSRPGRTSLTWLASSSSSSVVRPMALTTTTTWSPPRKVAAMWPATALMRSASPTEVPPYFCTTRATPRRYRRKSRSD